MFTADLYLTKRPGLAAPMAPHSPFSPSPQHCLRWIVNKRSSAHWVKVDLCWSHTIQAWWGHQNLCQICNPFHKLLMLFFSGTTPLCPCPIFSDSKAWRILFQTPQSPGHPSFLSGLKDSTLQIHSHRNPMGESSEFCMEFLLFLSPPWPIRLAPSLDLANTECTEQLTTVLFQNEILTEPH